jgi:DnaB-like helicase N terminal domain/AAA domain
MTSHGPEVPSNIEAEESYVGALLLDPHKLLDSMTTLSPEDFYRPLYGQIFAVVRDMTSHGEYVDYVTVQNELRSRGAEVELGVLSSLQLNTPGTHGAARWAQIILEKSDTRRTLHVLTDATSDLYDGADPYETSASISKELALLGTPADREPESLTLEEWIELSKSETSSPVIIPGIMRQGWRTIVVGGEGVAKTTILRTISMAVAQGHHPFWFSSKIIPRRVLYVDLENPLEVLGEPHVENFINYIKARDPDIYDPTRLKVWRRPGGINIRTQRDRADFQREIISHQPDLVCIGPLYKMYSGSSSERLDESAEEAMRVLDDLRTKYNFGLIMEHHAPKGQPGQKREMTPFGSSSWLRWAEIGISLYTDKTDPRIVNVRRFRGDRLGNVCWPDSINRNSNTIIGGKWDDRAPDLVTTSTR